MGGGPKNFLWLPIHFDVGTTTLGMGYILASFWKEKKLADYAAKCNFTFLNYKTKLGNDELWSFNRKFWFTTLIIKLVSLWMTGVFDYNLHKFSAHKTAEKSSKFTFHFFILIINFTTDSKQCQALSANRKLYHVHNNWLMIYYSHTCLAWIGSAQCNAILTIRIYDPGFIPAFLVHHLHHHPSRQFPSISDSSSSHMFFNSYPFRWLLPRYGYDWSRGRRHDGCPCSAPKLILSFLQIKMAKSETRALLVYDRSWTQPWLVMRRYLCVMEAERSFSD